MTKGRPLIDQTSLFSAVEGQPSRPTAVSPPPATEPFQAPDFGRDETFEDEPFAPGAHEPEPTTTRTTRTAPRRTARR